MIISEHTFFENLFRDKITVIDLGACKGEFINQLDNLFPIDKAILVEPNPTNFRFLPQKNNFILYNNSISSVDNNIINFYEDINSPYNGSNMFNYFNGILHEIKTVSLEKIVINNNIDYIDLLKIDIEGAEYDLLENLSDSIYSIIRQITVEFHDFINSELKPKTEQIVKKIEGLGFSRISKSWTYMHNSDHYDVIFYKNEKN